MRRPPLPMPHPQHGAGVIEYFRRMLLLFTYGPDVEISLETFDVVVVDTAN